ncbi:MAG: sugar ABC transporter ATP-binding protein [Armatimonadota bacterium]|nr:sugar ABC transporter ATP-binding protein [Armatimonadota bacterium]MDR7485497.1 sugar ABC transporter ATP-binding protein [Armatimonadota bacterium]MDR7533042.1 sugar ABC transporter ATP-binding protein [Armatimonadota bacterium]MDR7536786.1 sugar ABC transporter ATP-binding protein [Armatimonadota bacterium]
MTDVFLHARHISKRYGGVVALQDVDLEIRTGEIHCLVGENGSGKSTLIKIITGVVSPDPGAELEIGGERVRGLTPADALRRGIQVVHQDLALFPNLSVAENIAMLRVAAGGRRLVDWRAITAVAQAALERVGVTLPLETPVGTLPIADQQLVAICRALASDARLVITDEPTASLTQREVDRLVGILRDLQAHGIATLFVSHKLHEVLEIAQRITVLRDGRRVGTFARSEVDRDRLVQYMTGRTIAARRRPGRHPIGAAVLDVRGLGRRGHFRDVTFTLHRGEVLGLIGPLGSGKTELALALFGMNPPDAGEIAVEGRSVRLRTNADAIRAGIAYVPEDRLAQGVVARQPVRSNLIVTALDALTGPGRLLAPRRTAAFCDTAVRAFDIRTTSIEQPVSALSGGNQQKVVIAKWLSTRPRILVLDGPTVGIDVGARAVVYDIIDRLAEDGVGILLITEEVAEALAVCDRILVMKHGRIVAEVGREAASEADLHRQLTA